MFTSEKLTIQKINNFIYKVVFLEGAEIELEDSIQVYDYISKTAGGLKYCILLDATRQFVTTPEARAYIGSKDSRIAFAMVTNSLANRLVGNFFIQFNKPLSPTKLFSDEALAIQWLNEEKEKFDKQNA